MSSNFLSKATQRSNANLAVGVYWPVSIELIVFLETPTSLAKSACDKPFSLRTSGRLFFNTKLSSILIRYST